MADCCSISEEDAGVHFLMEVNTELSDDEVCTALEREGIKVSSVAQYYMENAGKKEHIFVMNYSSLEEENVEKVIRILEKVLVEGEGICKKKLQY